MLWNSLQSDPVEEHFDNGWFVMDFDNIRKVLRAVHCSNDIHGSAVSWFPSEYRLGPEAFVRCCFVPL